MRQICTLLFVLFSVMAAAQTAPTVSASNLRFTVVDGGGLSLAFDVAGAGGGTYHLIVMKEGSAVTGLPENGKEYTASTQFGTAGTEFTAPGEYVIQRSSWTTTNVEKLKPGTIYYVSVFEYNGTGANAKYLMVPVSNSKATAIAPDKQTYGVTFSEIAGNSVKMSWNSGTGAGRLILARKASPVNAEPADLKVYYIYNNGEYGTTTAINGDNHPIYRANGSSQTVTRLEPATTYHFASFEYNGSGSPVYLKPGFASTVTTNAGPTTSTQTIGFTAIEGNRMTVGYGGGNGYKRLVIARKGSPVTATAVNGKVYTPGAVFGSGDEIEPGEFIVSNSTNTSVTVTNLEPNTVYYFRVLEFDETSGGYTYYLNTPKDGSASTAAPPASVVTNLNVINITGSSATVTFSVGTGTGTYRLGVLKEGSAVDAIPQNLMTYGTGVQVAPGNYSLGAHSNGSSFALSSLKAGYTYHLAIFEFNGYTYPVYNKTPATVSFYVPLEPTQAAKSFSQQSREGDRMRIVWANGNGGKRIVIARKGAAVTYKPIDGSGYTASSVFTKGTEVADGEYVVHDDGSNYLDMTGLEIGATYHFAIFDYNTSDAGSNDYLTSAYLTGSAATLSYPTTQTNISSATDIQGTQATINFTAGNGGTRVFYMKAGSPVNVNPYDVATNRGYSTVFGTAMVGSTGNALVYRTSAASGSFTVTSLQPNTTYYLAAFEYNGSAAPAYLEPANTISFTTTDLPGATTPTVAASLPEISDVDGNKFTFKWKSGDGTGGRIVVMRAANAVNFIPASATNYTPNAEFGKGINLGDDQFVVYNGTGNTVTVTNLLPATTYYLTVFEYNGSGTLQRYLTSSVLAGTGASASVPTLAARDAVASSTTNSMTLTWTSGNGEKRMVVVKKSSNVLGAPVDLSLYPPDPKFTNGSQIALGEFVVYSDKGNSVTVTGLTPGDIYYYKIFEYNGSAAPVYNTSAALSGSVATGTLPVTWLYFNATQKSDKVVLNWGTSAEMNSAYFIVERSSNGIDFKEAGRVNASNNSVVDQHYSFNDAVTAEQKLYYRLKQTDKDGTYSYSKIVSVQTEGQATAHIQPNPVQQSFRVQLPDNTQNAVLAIYNAAGMLMNKQTINNMQQVNVQQLSAGVYYLHIQQGNKKFSLKMVKQ
jgi:hypothetical protein